MSTEFNSGRLIVKRNQGVSSTDISTLQAQIGVTKVTTASEFGIEIWDLPKGSNVDEIIAAYGTDGRFEYIERDRIIRVADVKTTSPAQQDLAAITPQITTPNDPDYPLLWALNNTGQTGGTPDADIDAPEAWDIETGDPNQVIGVIDTGVDYNHPDLVGNIWTNPGEIPGNGIDDDGNGYPDDVRGWDFAYGDNDPMDLQSHGTHVAGTIAAKGNNGVGVTGVNWDAKILPIKFLDDGGSGYTSNAILSLNYATANGVKITNNSWGGGGYDQGLYDAINSAGQQGALFIAAAGNWSDNNDINPFYPASYDLPNIISVAATDHNDGLAYFSHYGPNSVDLGAPGVNIYSTTPGASYSTYSGTSMASPHVAGGAALVWAQNPTWSAQEVKNRLLGTVDVKPSLSQTVSGGRLNLFNALGGPEEPSLPNDNFADRILLAGLPVGTTGSNIGATQEVGEPGQSGPINSVWWTWTAPTNETVNINTIGSNFDTYLSVFTGDDLPNLTLVGQNDDGGGKLASLVSLNTTAGQTYQIAVDGWASNTGQIALNFVVAPPPNDNFANASALTGETTTTTGSNRGATGEVGEPTQSGVTNSAWWYWTAPTTEIYNIDTRGSNFDTFLSVYEGSDLPNLTLRGQNDDGAGNLASLVSLDATAGTTYRLAVDGYSSGTGQIQLNVAPLAPPNDDFVNRIALTGDSANSTGTNIGATEEVGEPAQSGPINSAWWSWTATSSGFFQVDTIGSNSDTYLSIFDGPAVDNLTLIGRDDDAGGNLASLVNVNATPGTTYQLAVDGWSNRTGPINLNIAPTAPPNDNFANRITLTGDTVNATGSNIRATGETGEPYQSGETNSVWWTWTAPSTGTFNINTIGSGYDTWLALFTGSDVSNLSLVAQDDDSGGNYASRIYLNAIAGQTYEIAVEGWSNRIGPINLNIAPTPPGSGKLSAETANNTLKGEKDSLTGDTTSMFPPSSAKVPVTNIANIDKTDDLLIEGGSMINPTSLFSPTVNSAVPTLVKEADPMLTDANGALAGIPPLGINNAPFGVANTSPFADPNLVGVYEAKQPLGISLA
jgi:subtilisin family serine protease